MAMLMAMSRRAVVWQDAAWLVEVRSRLLERLKRSKITIVIMPVMIRTGSKAMPMALRCDEVVFFM